ncbi:hypothetical protein BDW72DRAFT_180508 [Aspergillus terricola var. indicus]
MDLLLAINLSGVHLHSYGAKNYLVGCPPIGPGTAVNVNDFSFAEMCGIKRYFRLLRVGSLNLPVHA